MSGCKEPDFLWEALISPAKKKRKKETKKDKKCLKRSNSITMKTDENIQKKKKKKNPKLKETTVGKKPKKKEKKRKKNRLALGLDDSFIFTQAGSAQAKPTVSPETSNPGSNDKLTPDHLTRDSKKKSKKKVAFHLSPGCIAVKRPKFVSSSPLCPKESIFLENEAVRVSESSSQVTVTGHSQEPAHDIDSQCTSEDINSQDLFITQKAFRESPPEPSSGEASDKAIPSTPQMFTQRDKLHTSVTQIKQHLEGSYKCPQDSNYHQQHRETNEHTKKPKTVQVLLAEEEDEEEEGLNKAHRKNKKEKLSFKTQMGQSANLTRKKKVLCPVPIEPSGVNPYPAEPIDVNPFLDVAKPKKHSLSSQQSTTSTSTQTENLFTTELSSYCNFFQKRRVTSHFGDLEPLDLSLAQRARKDLGSCLVAKPSSLPGEIKGGNHKEANLCPCCSSAMNDLEVKREPSGVRPLSVRTQGKSETTRSPQSESEAKSSDTTTSSEDDPQCRTGKLDLTQVRAVQMRLNESFFFKTKGEGRSPRPESPLMKLAQSTDVKSKKGH